MEEIKKYFEQYVDDIELSEVSLGDIVSIESVEDRVMVIEKAIDAMIVYYQYYGDKLRFLYSRSEKDYWEGRLKPGISVEYRTVDDNGGLVLVEEGELVSKSTVFRAGNRCLAMRTETLQHLLVLNIVTLNLANEL